VLESPTAVAPERLEADEAPPEVMFRLARHGAKYRGSEPGNVRFCRIESDRADELETLIGGMWVLEDPMCGRLLIAVSLSGPGWARP